MSVCVTLTQTWGVGVCVTLTQTWGVGVCLLQAPFVLRSVKQLDSYAGLWTNVGGVRSLYSGCLLLTIPYYQEMKTN